jgi:hypothetical protein
VRLFFRDNRIAALYVTRSDYGVGTAPQKAKTIDEARKNRPWIPETTTLDGEGHLKDKVDYPFVTDVDVLGTWKVVDVVREKDQFVPGKQWWRDQLDLLQGLRFDKVAPSPCQSNSGTQWLTAMAIRLGARRRERVG